MVLAHHGQSVPEADLRHLLRSKASGTPARNLLAAVALGLEIQLGASNLAQVRAALAAGEPPIVFLDTGALEYWSIDCAHTAAVVGVDVTTVYLNDPFFDSAPQQTSLVNFLKAWACNRHHAAFLQPSGKRQ
jgi:ABC-type bacteriocin/lantibiotic exporter with double-glycine peptidase domain